MPRIRLNGEEQTVAEAASLADLLQSLKVPPQNLVVEYNGTVLAAGQYATTKLADGDVIELVRFVGGG
ncbi:MAG: sulfur carrier protein ThiS [Myxococcales bacterium]|nr:sulfur carrier protein ThiS [Myxococcales bacterium]